MEYLLDSVILIDHFNGRKGANLVTNEETVYKQALGDDWAALDPESRYFKIVGDSDVHEVLREVAEL